MKIKMTTFAITVDNKMFENRRVLEVGKDISKEKADEFLKANFAFIVEEDKIVESALKTEESDEVIAEEKPAKKKRGK